jgi:GTP cyclohydrolase I
MRAVSDLLEMVGEDLSREDLVETPYRVAKMYLTELLSGYQEDPADIFTTFDGGSYDQMVLLKDIPLASMCAHHLQPFVGKIHVGYIPRDRVVGLSKIVRLVNIFARRLQLQEKLTAQVADAMQEHLDPLGVMVVAEAEHFCMTLRGVQTPGTRTVTSAVRGVFLDPEKHAREEFLSLIK